MNVTTVVQLSFACGLVVSCETVTDGAAFLAELAGEPRPRTPRAIAKRVVQSIEEAVEEVRSLAPAVAAPAPVAVAPELPPKAARRGGVPRKVAPERPADAEPVVAAPPAIAEPEEPRREGRAGPSIADGAVAAFRKNQAYPIPKLAGDLYGEQSARNILKTKLLLERLCDSGRLRRLGVATFAVPVEGLEELERAHRNARSLEVLEDDGEQLGGSDDDELEDERRESEFDHDFEHGDEESNDPVDETEKLENELSFDTDE